MPLESPYESTDKLSTGNGILKGNLFPAYLVGDEQTYEIIERKELPR
jgi:hypothetical protein